MLLRGTKEKNKVHSNTSLVVSGEELKLLMIQTLCAFALQLIL